MRLFRLEDLSFALGGLRVCVIYSENEKISSGYRFISSNGTNNEAEYHALIDGLKEAIRLNISEIIVKGDSKLVINQVQNKWKTKSVNLIPLYKEATELLKKFSKISFKHIPRSENKEADSLANKGMDFYKKLNPLT